MSFGKAAKGKAVYRRATKTVQLQRRQRVVDLYMQGVAQHVIAERLGISQQTVSRDVREAEATWLADLKGNIDLIKAAHLAKLEHLAATYWDAWERSKKQAVSKTARRHVRTGKDGKPLEGQTEGEPVETIATMTDQVGNPAFLAGIERIMQEKAKLFGLYQQLDPSQLGAFSWANLLAGRSLDAMDRELALFARMARAAGMRGDEIEMEIEDGAPLVPQVVVYSGDTPEPGNTPIHQPGDED
jgi:predicted transcriptional regulator